MKVGEGICIVIPNCTIGGIKGMKWGVRRYQNKDGSLTPAGRKRQAAQYTKQLNDLDNASVKTIAKKMRFDIKAEQYANKGRRIAAKTGAHQSDSDRRKIYKNAQNAVKYSNKSDSSLAQLRELESKTWKTIGKAMSEDYTINSKKKSIKMQRKVASLYKQPFSAR